MICNNDTFNMFTIKKIIQENENQKVYIANIKDKFKIIVLKVEQGDNKYLYNQYKILNFLKFVLGVPKILNFGFTADEKFYYSIDYYDKSVSDILKKYGTLSLQSVLSIGLSLLRILSAIHRQEIIYCNICPENIVFSKEGVDHESKIHLIGFGQSFYTYDKPKTIQNNNFLPYQSYQSHNNNVFQKKDDLESLGYLLIKLRKGTLPWESLPHQLMGKKKIECLKSNEVFKGLPYEFRLYFKQLEQFNDQPKYQYFIKLLNAIMIKYCKTTRHCIQELNQLTSITEISDETISSIGSFYSKSDLVQYRFILIIKFNRFYIILIILQKITNTLLQLLYLSRRAVMPSNLSSVNLLTNTDLDSSIEQKLKKLELITKQYKLMSNL